MDVGRRVRMLTLFATALGSALAFLDTTVVIVALPSMDEDLGLGLSGQQWVYLAYALSLSAFYLVGGAIGDRVGLRRTFVVGVVLFALGVASHGARAERRRADRRTGVARCRRRGSDDHEPRSPAGDLGRCRPAARSGCGRR